MTLAPTKVSEDYVGEVQVGAMERADEFLAKAAEAATGREAADWSLAAKNAVSIALTSEQILKTRRAR